MAQQRRQLSVAGKQGSCNSKLFFTTSAHATSGRGFLHLRKCLKCTLHTEVLPNGETTYTLESSVSSLTIQNTTNSTRSSNTTGEKKKDKWRTSTLRGWLPFAARKRGHASFGTYHKITETGGSWDSHSFFLFVENFRGLQIFTQHKSRFHHSPLPWVSMSILGIPMGIQCVSWVSFPLPSPHSWRSAPRAPGARRS